MLTTVYRHAGALYGRNRLFAYTGHSMANGDYAVTTRGTDGHNSRLADSVVVRVIAEVVNRLGYAPHTPRRRRPRASTRPHVQR